jgi:hypothetical protein
MTEPPTAHCATARFPAEYSPTRTGEEKIHAELPLKSGALHRIHHVAGPDVDTQQTEVTITKTEARGMIRLLLALIAAPFRRNALRNLLQLLFSSTQGFVRADRLPHAF